MLTDSSQIDTLLLKSIYEHFQDNSQLEDINICKQQINTVTIKYLYNDNNNY